jgi:hypothetical protein
MWNAKQHSYEELRNVVVDVLHQRISGNNQYMTLVEHTARVINEREGSNVDLGTGFAYQGAAGAALRSSQLFRSRCCTSCTCHFVQPAMYGFEYGFV